MKLAQRFSSLQAAVKNLFCGSYQEHANFLIATAGHLTLQQNNRH
jgi:hypothetical protein